MSNRWTGILNAKIETSRQTVPGSGTMLAVSARISSRLLVRTRCLRSAWLGAFGVSICLAFDGNCQGIMEFGVVAFTRRLRPLRPPLHLLTLQQLASEASLDLPAGSLQRSARRHDDDGEGEELGLFSDSSNQPCTRFQGGIEESRRRPAS